MVGVSGVQGFHPLSRMQGAMSQGRTGRSLPCHGIVRGHVFVFREVK